MIRYQIKVAVVQTGSLLSFSIYTITRMGSLAGFLDTVVVAGYCSLVGLS